MLKQEARNEFSYFIKSPNRAEYLYVINLSGMSDAEKTMIGTLQGIVAKKSAQQIYILDDVRCDYSVWLNDLRVNYRVGHEIVSDPWTLFELFKIYLEGYVLYQSDDCSINAACSLTGLKNAVAVDETLEETVRSHGLENMLIDVRGKDDKWIKENYWDELNHSFVIEQKSEKTPYLRDYATMTNSFVFFDGNSDFRASVLADIGGDKACIGWGDSSEGEEKFVGPGSEKGIFTIPADWGLNISVYCGFNEQKLTQDTHVNFIREEDTHYVTFLITDGDNLQWALGDLYGGERWWGSSKRGTFNMGWALSPTMFDLAPTVMKYYYKTAANGKFNDYFVAGPSGSGYMYPSMYPEKELDKHVKRLNSYMKKADLNIVEIIDFDAFESNYLWDKYTSQTNIDAIFYLEYCLHNKYKGAIKWSNGKPIINPREMLWDGLPGCDASTVVKNLNSASVDIYSVEGYSLVLVHAWSPVNGSMESVGKIVDALNEKVKVVTPEEFVKLIKDNLGGETQEFLGNP